MEDDEDHEHNDNDILEDILDYPNAGNSFQVPHVAQSEYSFPITSSTIVHNAEQLHDRLQGLHVSDHPRQMLQVASGIDPGTSESNSNTNPSPKPTVRVRRNSAGDETMLYCDFGDFNTQELISSPIDFEQGNKDFLAYSTHSESASSHAMQQQTVLAKPIPFNPPRPVSNTLYQNMAFTSGVPQGSLMGPPQLPPKTHIPPPYRPPPAQYLGGPPRSLEEDHFHKTHHSNIAMAASDGGSHDSHNDSGYCAVRGSGGPSPSLSGNDEFSIFHVPCYSFLNMFIRNLIGVIK